jgi:hypothetical protein
MGYYLLRFADALAAVMVAVLAAGCSTLPSVEYSYYLSKMKVSISVTEVITCTGNVPAYTITPLATTEYSADTRIRYPIRIKDIEGFFSPFADSSMGMTFTDDGRLKGINQSTTGQGEAIIKAAASLAGAIIAGGGAPVKSALPEGGCAAVRSLGGDKGVTLLYYATIDSDNVSPNPPLNLEPQSKALHDAIGTVALPLALRVTPVDKSDAPHVQNIGGIGDDVAITLQKTASVTVTLFAKGSDYWHETLVVPLKDQTYQLPIPKAALFGGQTFSLALTDAGAVTSITYGKTQGFSGSLNAASSAVGVEAAGDAAKASAIKAQADIIAQSQRLANCKANPTKCT